MSSNAPIPNLRDTLFLRMTELLQGHAPFLWDEGQRKAFADGWNEIALLALREADVIRDERNEEV